MIIAQKPRVYPRVKAVENPPYFPSDLRYDHDFTVSPYLPQGFTFSRSGTALAWQGGQYVSKGSNVERIEDLDYLGFSGRKGLLIEGARTNQLLRSSEIDSSPWAVINVASITPNSHISPDGTQNADTLALGNSAASDCARQIVVATTASLPFVYKVWLKAASISDVGNTVQIAIVRTTGTATSATQTITLTANWQLCQTLVTFASDNSGYRVEIRSTGTATSAAVWQNQVEQASFSSSPIPTAGSTGTRNAETCSRSVTLPSGGFTVVYEFVTAVGIQSGIDQNLGRFKNSDNSTFLDFYKKASDGHLWLDARTSSVNQASIDLGAIGTLTRARGAIRYEANNIAASINGGEVAKDTSCSLGTMDTEQLCTNSAGSGQAYGNILRCNASPTRWRPPVSDAELVALSTLT